ncbi:XdhC family protein [Iodidimonas sp. SYSU 1G8]|uniref:XdhC family protein n=1 Tax=Iodidimonas sp. SYSU 1G8 TaxID=3133967 RepID=UPI0031FED392
MSIEVLKTARDWRREGRGVAIATVSSTWGSAPFPVGSQLAADDKGNFVGSVSGGCIEGAVIGEARQAIKDGKIRNLEFSVSDDQAWEVGLACGGTIRVFVEPIPNEIDRVLEAADRKQSVALTTDLHSGAHTLYDTASAPEPVRGAMRDDRSQPLEDGAFVRVFNTPRRIAIVGAVHIAQELVPMATRAGFDVTVIDPREAFASPERFPGVKLSTDWPDKAMRALEIDPRTAIVTLTHDPKLDDPALDVALASDAFYVGALGSKRTQAKRVTRLTEAGFTQDQIGRIHGPIGLDIRAQSPAEIAVSILAQIIAVQRGAMT